MSRIEHAERAKLIFDLHSIAESWLDIDCAISSIILGTVAALKAGVSHELAVYLLDFSKACLNPEMKKKLLIDMDLIGRQAQLVRKNRPTFIEDTSK